MGTHIIILRNPMYPQATAEFIRVFSVSVTGARRRKVTRVSVGSVAGLRVSITSPAPDTRPGPGADGCTLAAARKPANHRADDGSAADLGGIGSVVGRGMAFEAVGLNRNRLAIRRVQPRQLDCQCSIASGFGAGLRRHHPALHPRAPFGDYPSVHHQLFIERGRERVALLVAIRGKPVHEAHRNHHSGVQRHRVRRLGCGSGDRRRSGLRRLRCGCGCGWRGHSGHGLRLDLWLRLR